MRDSFARFLCNDEGATSIEYALIAAFIFLAIINVLQLISVELNGTFSDVQSGMQKRPKV